MLDRDKITYIKKSLGYLKKYKKLSFLIIALSLLSSLFGGISLGTIVPVLQSLISKNAVINISVLQYFGFYRGAPPSQIEIILLYLSFILVAIILKNIFTFLNNFCISKITYSIRRNLQVNLFEKVINSSWYFFVSSKSGDLIGNIYSYTANIAEFVNALLSLVAISSRFLVYLTLLFILSWKLTGVIIVVGLLGAPILGWLLIRVRRISLQTTRVISDLYSYMSEMFHNVYLIKIFSSEVYEKNRFTATADKFANVNIRLSKYTFFIRPFFETAFVELLCIVLAIAFIYVPNIFDKVPLLVAYSLVLLRLFDQTGLFISFLSSMFQNVAPFKMYENTFAEAERAVVPDGPIRLTHLNQGINFKNISFGYTTDKLILKDVDLNIPKGKTVAIVGPTGAGKTTLVNLIEGFYLPSHGQVCIDGVDIKEINISDWRKKIGYVPQDTYIFDDSVKNNILYGKPEATYDEVVSAAEAVGLHEYIIKLPNGYDTILGERGVRWSGGQKQRLAIARIIIRQPEVLILDEATSSLDNATEYFIKQALTEIFKHTTVITIAHRLSTIINADQVFVLREGQIIEKGTHRELLAVKDSFYHYLYNFDLQK